MDKELILMIGLPRSGKSTWAMEYSRVHDVPVVNPDAIRMAMYGQPYIASMESYVWAIARTMVKTLFLTGYDTVIVDATNMRRQWRSQWKNKEWTTKYKVIDTPIETCLERAESTKQDYLAPVIKKMAKDYEELTEDESVNRMD